MPYAASDGARIYYEVAGSGPPIVLHSGFVGTVENWVDAGYVSALQDRFQLIMLDPRGQGRSNKPYHAEDYSRQRRVSDVLTVVNALGIGRAHFWGYSMGGWVGFELGAAAPDRFRSLILGGAFPFPGNPRPLEGDFWLDSFRQGMTEMVRHWDDTDPDFWFSTREREQWLASDAEALSAARRQRLTEPDLSEERVAAIDVPTLIYAGTLDSTLDDPEEIEQVTSLMPNASFVALEGLNHSQSMGRSDLVLPHVLPFLERVESVTGDRS